MPEIRVRRVYDAPSPADGARVLVDRIWPRGLRKDAAHLTEWAKDAAPSTELRQWYGHDPEKFQRVPPALPGRAVRPRPAGRARQAARPGRDRPGDPAHRDPRRRHQPGRGPGPGPAPAPGRRRRRGRLLGPPGLPGLRRHRSRRPPRRLRAGLSSVPPGRAGVFGLRLVRQRQVPAEVIVPLARLTSSPSSVPHSGDDLGLMGAQRGL